MTIDRELEGGYPYYMNAHQAVYLTRGLEAELEGRGITYAQWIEVVQADPQLSLDEVYTQHNPNAGRDETWREAGRLRWPATGEPCEHIRYFPAHITATYPCRLPSRKLSERFAKIIAEIGQFPTLPRWREYAEEHGMLTLEERFQWGGRECYQPGRMVTSQGEIYYRPSAAWMYYGMDVNGVSREAKLRELAARQDARVMDGNKFTQGCVD